MQGSRLVRAPRGPRRTARSWGAEAALRMLQNNLDPDVAERPDDLVVYGGSGRAARDWRSFDAIVDSLTTMPNTGVTERDARDIAAYLYTLR